MAKKILKGILGIGGKKAAPVEPAKTTGPVVTQLNPGPEEKRVLKRGREVVGRGETILSDKLGSSRQGLGG
jgi:hypothetical protein